VAVECAVADIVRRCPDFVVHLPRSVAAERAGHEERAGISRSQTSSSVSS